MPSNARTMIITRTRNDDILFAALPPFPGSRNATAYITIETKTELLC
jgi:hypothetical protein